MAGMMIQQGVYTKEQRERIQPQLNIGTVPGAFEQDLFQMYLGFASYTCEAQHSELLNRLGFWCDTDPKRPCDITYNISSTRPQPKTHCFTTGGLVSRVEDGGSRWRRLARVPPSI